MVFVVKRCASASDEERDNPNLPRLHFVAKESSVLMNDCSNSKFQTNLQNKNYNKDQSLDRSEDGSLQSFRMIQMLFHPQVSVRMELVDRREATYEILMQLTRDVSADVRFALAENHNIAEEILLELMNDENPYVQERARKTFLRKRKAEMTVVFRDLCGENSLIETRIMPPCNQTISNTAS